MTTVCGLDLSLTSTGIALVMGDPPIKVHAETFAVGTTGRLKDDVATRAARLSHLARDIVDSADGVDLVVVEGPSIGSMHGSQHDRSGLWWLVVSRLWLRDVPVAVVPPTTLKKWATGRGNADKSAVSVAVSRMWPEVAAETNDEWDALAAATMGAQHLGLNVPTLGRHAESLTKVEWPVFPDVEGVAA